MKRIHLSAICAAALLLASNQTGVPLSAAAAHKPNLVVSRLKVAVLSARPGARISVTETTKNIGTARAASSHTRIYLSFGRTKTGSIRLSRGDAVSSLKPSKSVKVKAKHKIRWYVPTGKYSVVACANAGSKVTESNEADNCRVAKVRFKVVPHPLDVRVAVERRDRVSAVISTESSTPQTLHTTDAAGNSFVLSLPQYSLLSPERITMTPIKSITGTPLSRPVIAGVDLEPSGLQLQQPATLTITPAHAVPLRQQHAFSADGTGHDFHRYPLDPTRKKIRLHISHFSTWDTGTGSNTDLNSVEIDTPSVTAAQLEGIIAPVSDDTREGTSAPGERIRMVNEDEKYFESIARSLQYAETIDLKNENLEDKIVNAAVIAAVGWIRQKEILGDGEWYQMHLQFIRDELRKIMVHQFNLSYKRCLNNFDPREQLIDMLVAFRQLTMRDAEGDLGPGVWDKINRCAGDYQLDFSGNSQSSGHTLWSQVADFSSTDVSVHATHVPLRLDQTFQYYGPPSFSGGGPDVPLSVDTVSGVPYNKSCKKGRGIYKAQKAKNDPSSIAATFYPDINVGPEVGKVDHGILIVSPSDHEAAMSQCGSEYEYDVLNFFQEGYVRAWEQKNSNSAGYGAFYYPGGRFVRDSSGDGLPAEPGESPPVFKVHFEVTVTPVE